MEGQRILTEVFSERGRGTHPYTLPNKRQTSPHKRGMGKITERQKGVEEFEQQFYPNNFTRWE
jgi:hypothetical protein